MTKEKEKRNVKDYLKDRGSEVLNMLVAEYDYDMDIAVQREEAEEYYNKFVD